MRVLGEVVAVEIQKIREILGMDEEHEGGLE